MGNGVKGWDRMGRMIREGTDQTIGRVAVGSFFALSFPSRAKGPRSTSSGHMMAHVFRPPDLLPPP